MNKLMAGMVALVLTATFGIASVAPASADQAAVTRNEILGAAALIAGIAISANVAHKNAQANAIVGYDAYGNPIYGNGSVGYQNGSTTNNYPNAFANGNGNGNGYGYPNAYNNGYPNAYANNGYPNAYANNGYPGYAYNRSRR